MSAESRRTVATPTALSAARQMRSLGAVLQPQARQIIAEGQRLAQPSTWDGVSAAHFRAAAWPQLSRSMSQALRSLDELDAHVERVIQDILRSGATSLAPARPAPPKPASHHHGWGGWGWVHAALTVASFIPVVGTGASLVNAGLYAAQGDYTDAALSAAMAIPVAGVAVRAAADGLKIADEGARVVRAGDEAVRGERVFGAEAPIHAGNATQEAFDQAFPELTNINPEFKSGEWGFKNNCPNCAIATDRNLAAGEQTVSAAKVDPIFSVRSLQVVEQAVGGGRKFGLVYTYGAIERELFYAKDGARGIVAISRFDTQSVFTSGHLFNVVNRGGRIYFIDGQRAGWARLESGVKIEFLRTA